MPSPWTCFPYCCSEIYLRGRAEDVFHGLFPLPTAMAKVIPNWEIRDIFFEAFHSAGSLAGEWGCAGIEPLRSLRVDCAASVMSWIDWVADRRKRDAGLPGHLRTGLAGEEAAFFELRRRGFQVVAQRWNDTPIPGDIDLIAWDRSGTVGVLCFVEVKTRTSREVATASLAVDRHKRRMIRRLARHYLRHLAGKTGSDEPSTRFDIVTVYDVPGTAREITLIPGAFGWREERES